jgi:tetratricopeptide (TPR) repeat protein
MKFHAQHLRTAARAGLLLAASALLFFHQSRTAGAQQSAAGTVNVRVTGEGREELIDQAEVRLLNFAAVAPTARAYTDGGGRVTFAGVRRGRYYVEVEKAGYETARESVDVAPGSSEFVAVQLRRRADSRAGGEAKPGTVSAAAVPAAARKAYEDGLAALKTDPAKAVEHFKRAVAEFPAYAEAHAFLGLAHMRRGETADAKSTLSKAIELDPKLPVARTLLGKLLLEERKFDEAEKMLTEGVALDPAAWDAHYELARCYFNTGRLDKALAEAERAHDAQGAPSSTHLLLVDIYLRRRDRPRALRELKEFAKADPQSPFMPRVREMIERLRAEEDGANH